MKNRQYRNGFKPMWLSLYEAEEREQAERRLINMKYEADMAAMQRERRYNDNIFRLLIFVIFATTIIGILLIMHYYN